VTGAVAVMVTSIVAEIMIYGIVRSVAVQAGTGIISRRIGTDKLGFLPRSCGCEVQAAVAEADQAARLA